MTKLCPRGKAAAKRKFKVYPSAYANAYASKICAGKIKDPSGVKRKDFKGRKPAAEGGPINKMVAVERRTVLGKPRKPAIKKDSMSIEELKRLQRLQRTEKPRPRKKMMGGGLMEATQRLRRQGLRKGGGADTGKLGELKSKLGVIQNQIKRKTERLEKLKSARESIGRAKKMGGGMMRPMYRKGGGVCLRGMNRDAIGKNS